MKNKNNTPPRRQAAKKSKIIIEPQRRQETYIHVDMPAQMHISTSRELNMPVYGFSISMMLSITSYTHL
jgi:hypothetical protein